MILVFAGTAELTLERRREDDEFEPVLSFSATVPIITSPPARSVETGRDRVLAFIRHQLHATLAKGRLGPGVYRVRYNGEAVIDCWNGEAMIGCVDTPHPGGVNCGVFACRYPPTEP